MITQLDLLPSLPPSQDWIRTQLIDGLINSFMGGELGGVIGSQQSETTMQVRPLEGARGWRESRELGDGYTGDQCAGCLRRRWLSSLLARCLVQQPLLHAPGSAGNPGTAALSPGSTLAFQGSLQTPPFPKVPCSPVQPELQVGPSYHLSR